MEERERKREEGMLIGAQIRDYLSGGKDFPRLTMYSRAFNASSRDFDNPFQSRSKRAECYFDGKGSGGGEGGIRRNARNLTPIRDETEEQNHYRANEQARPNMEAFQDGFEGNKS